MCDERWKSVNVPPVDREAGPWTSAHGARSSCTARAVRSISVPPRERLVLAALAVDAGRLVPVSTLIDRVWGPDAPPGARPTLRVYLTHLRKALTHAGRGQRPTRSRGTPAGRLPARRRGRPGRPPPRRAPRQPPQQFSPCPGRVPSLYPGSSSRLRFCCPHKHMIDRRLRPSHTGSGASHKVRPPMALPY